MSDVRQQRRSERSRRAILRSALELCGDVGFDNTTIEAIAKHAGVGKQTIYRWWRSKAAVIEEAMNQEAAETLDFPDTGDIVADLRKQMSAVAELFASPKFSPYAGLIAAAQSDTAVAQSLIHTMIHPRVAALRERLERARERGQLRDDVDLDDVIELLYGPLYYRLLLHTRPTSTDQVSQILDLAFNGLTPSQSP